MASIKLQLREIKAEKRKRSEIEAARLFAELFRDKLVYVEETEIYMYFDGRRWKPDKGNVKALTFAQEFAEGICGYLDDIENEAALKFYSRYEGLTARKRLIEDAKRHNMVSVEVFDKKPSLFNCLNGTLNMANRMLRAHDPADMLTLVSNVVYDPKAHDPAWDKFVSEIMEDDPDLIRYLQRCAGYSMTKHTCFECFFIGLGKRTRNGKSTFDEVLSCLMGDYADGIDPGSIEVKKSTGSIRELEGMAGLREKSYVSVYEPKRRMIINEALVKAVTGHDPINAARLYEGRFKYRAEFKLWIYTNSLPVIEDDTVFASDRLHIIPFNHHFEEGERDIFLKNRLQQPEVLSTVLNWLIEGYEDALHEGKIEKPQEVKELIAEYAKTDNYGINAFMAEYMEEVPGVRCPVEILLRAYNLFWIEHDKEFMPLSTKGFRRVIKERFPTITIQNALHVVGWRLREDIKREWLALQSDRMTAE